MKSVLNMEACDPGICSNTLQINEIHIGDARHLIKKIRSESIALSIWSPPYFVGKEYEKGWTFTQWRQLLDQVIASHFNVIKPGGFMAVNIADILCFDDLKMPRIQADNVSKRRSPVTREQILDVLSIEPHLNRHEVAARLGCSEQTVDRRLKNNNIRGGKYNVQTRVELVGSYIESAAYDVGLYLYDRRIWVKDPAWENSKWHSSSYRAVDEFEYLYIFWKPGITRIDRDRLSKNEWRDWGSRAVWNIPSVRANDDHPAKFPLELVKRAILLLTDKNDIVLDPFMGSGTTAEAALVSGRNYIGIEFSPIYVALARKRASMLTFG